MKTNRAPEFLSIENFVQHLIDDDRNTFTHQELGVLATNLMTSPSKLRTDLEGYGLSLAQRQPERVVRGFQTSSHDRWYGPGSCKTAFGPGIDHTTGRATVTHKTV